jgi:membrane protease subunit HflK
VVWNIKPEQADNYAFMFKDPQKTVKAVAESTMREYIGRGRILELITEDRLNIAPAVRTSIQLALDSYNMGINISSVQLADALAPQDVRQAFYNVEAASQKAARYVNDAQRDANRIMPQARADAAKIRAGAEAYRQSKIQEATGQAARFSQILEAYKKAPDIIRERMYLETMERVLGMSSKTIVDTDSNTIINASGTQSVVPIKPQQQTSDSGGSSASSSSSSDSGTVVSGQGGAQ